MHRVGARQSGPHDQRGRRRVLFLGLALMQLGTVPAPYAAPGASRAVAQGNSPEQDCFHAAHTTQLGDRRAVMLCRSAPSPGPVLCYKSGQERTSLTDPQLFALCRCAQSDSPVDCYERARNDSQLDYPALLRRCSAIAVDHLSANCRPPRD